MGLASKYPPELRERAVRMVFDHQHDYPSQWKGLASIANAHEKMSDGSRRPSASFVGHPSWQSM